MCGRARLAYSFEQIQDIVKTAIKQSKSIKREVDIKPSCLNDDEIIKNESLMKFESIENVSPGMELPVIFYSYETSRLEVMLMKWGLISSKYAHKDAKNDHYKMFNARIETLHERVSYRDLLQRNRCIIIINGFYEWISEFGHKVPYYISFSNDQPMMLAGLYDHNSLDDSYSFTIITCNACKQMEHIHDRQPVFLTPEQMHDWINPQNSASSLISSLLRNDYTHFDINCYEVSSKMTNPKYQLSDCIKPVVKQPKLAFFNSKPSLPIPPTSLSSNKSISTLNCVSSPPQSKVNPANDSLKESFETSEKSSHKRPIVDLCSDASKHFKLSTTDGNFESQSLVKQGAKEKGSTKTPLNKVKNNSSECMKNKQTTLSFMLNKVCNDGK